MEEDKPYKNISKYIFNKEACLDPEKYNFNDFSITNYDYKQLFPGNSYVTNKDLLSKFFETVSPNDGVEISDLFKSYIRAEKVRGNRRWKVPFIFFMLIPFTDYEFHDSGGHIINLDKLTLVSDSYETDNILIGTFSKINFVDICEMPIVRFENNLRKILNTELIYNNKYTYEQVRGIVISLLRLRFDNKHSYINEG